MTLAGGVAAAVAVLVLLVWLARRRSWRIPFLARAAGGPGCHRCQSSYRIVQPHGVYVVGLGTVIGILCERCWRELGTPDRRIDWYAKALGRSMQAAWNAGDRPAAEQIQAEGMLTLRAVRDGG